MANRIFILYAGNERIYPIYYLDQQLHNVYMNNNNNILYIVSTHYGGRKSFGDCTKKEKLCAALARLSNELLLANKKAQETLLRSVLQNESRCWTEFCRYVKRREGNRENIPKIMDHNGKLFTDRIEKTNYLNS